MPYSISMSKYKYDNKIQPTQTQVELLIEYKASTFRQQHEPRIAVGCLSRWAEYDGEMIEYVSLKTKDDLYNDGKLDWDQIISWEFKE